MRYLLLAFFGIGTLVLAGCKWLGYNPQSAENQLTPTGGERTYIRTWQTDPATGQSEPTVEEVAPKK